MLNRRIKHFSRKLFLVLALLLALVILMIQCHSSSSDTPAEHLKSIATDQKICAVTASVTGIESEEAIRLFMSVCRGTGIVPCVFVTVDWLEGHTDAMELLEGAELGLLFLESPQKWSNKRTMAAIAEANESFMRLTGSFPNYVRISDGNASQAVDMAMQSYGQMLIGSSLSLTDAPSPGGIADCDLLDSTTGYTLAQYYGTTLSQGYTVQPLSQLLSK